MPSPSRTDPAAAGSRLLGTWKRVRGWPFGGRIMGWIVGRFAPYTGSVSPEVVALEPGSATAAIEDRRRLRNHVRSIHAIALVNLGELVTGLALMTSLPPGVRGIPVGLAITYEKKARGRIEASCHCEPPTVGGEAVETEAHADLRDAEGDLVARVTARWRLAPVPAAPA